LADLPGATPYPYAYPPSQHQRRHGPDGYQDYDSYRPWLRDEFTFRCVYCLYREQWPRERQRSWDIDHFTPQVVNPDLTLTYDNLLYVCASCNSIKSSKDLPDPCGVAIASSLQVDKTGKITALTKEAKILVDVLRLDSEERTMIRRDMIEIIDLAATHKRTLHRRLMGYPQDLPDLSKFKPAQNTRQAGINDSFFARHQRGELDEIY
jgi:HNH endonuclease